MKWLLVGLSALALLAGRTGAQYHDPVYILGGYATTSTFYWNGIWLGDAGKQTLKHLTPKQKVYGCFNAITMDVDNKHVLFAAYGTSSTSTVYQPYLRSGIYRLDPATLAITTVLADSIALFGPRSLIVNQDGDYVFACYQYRRTPTLQNNCVLKLTSAGTTLTTILDRTQLGSPRVTVYSCGRNIDTGLYFINLYRFNTFYYTVLECDDKGVFTTFGGGRTSSMYGWYGYYDHMEQNFETGHIMGQYYRVLYQLRKGDAHRTTLWNLGYPPNHWLQYTSRFDLRSAPSKRIVSAGYVYHPVGPPNPKPFSYYSASVYQVDVTPPFRVTGVDLDPKNATGVRYTRYAYGLDFYRGRHLQPLKLAPRQWDLRISCPRHPGKVYLAAVSASGVRPGIKLADGRTINLVPDALTFPSAQGRLRPFFDPGPGKLDPGGEAVGKLDLRLLPGLGGLPIWIAVAVLDPQAPGGIAYLPDTYVFRIP